MSGSGHHLSVGGPGVTAIPGGAVATVDQARSLSLIDCDGLSGAELLTVPTPPGAKLYA
jgi:hypothetical protein